MKPPSTERVTNAFRESIAVKEKTLEQCLPSIIEAARLIADAFRQKNVLYLCGNGGSAADCQHVATEFTCRLSKDFEREALPAVALTTDTSFLTAYPNDYEFQGIFSRQIEALGRKNDVLIGISTSGSSGNIIRAFEAAKQRSMKCIALTGEGGTLVRLADIAISVPSSRTNRIQESHLCIEHTICDLVEQELFGNLSQPIKTS